ncbi:MAG TPA: WD40 repeat domain-containing protein [Sandaracinaceae bacterium LLY-WYZ-13_1]|nr:WD40 repeat domain-containing protein [Sandaracinaceae bacterium LLY-WYZ-13_1]
MLPRGERAFGSNRAGEVKLWNLTKKKPKAKRLDLGEVSLEHFALLPPGDRVIADCSDARLRVVAVEAGEVLRELPEIRDRRIVDSLRLSEDGSLLAMGGTDEAVRLWRL